VSRIQELNISARFKKYSVQMLRQISSWSRPWRSRRGSGYISSLSLTLALDESVRSTPRPGRFTSSKETRYSFYGRLVKPRGQSERIRKNLASASIRFPDRPAHGESLYRLNYVFGSQYQLHFFKNFFAVFLWTFRLLCRCFCLLTYFLTYLLTPYSTVLLQKLTGFQLLIYVDVI
jgi:hypothetical protein